MRLLRIAALCAVCAVVGCGGGDRTGVTGPSSGSGTSSGGSGSGSSSNATGAGVAAGTPVFSQSPIGVSQISTLVPIGNLNPPDHTLPTNHSYFFHQSIANAEVFAPAGGTVTDISHGNDDQILIGAVAGFQFYLGHVLVDAS